MVIITRNTEIKKIRECGDWKLVYGRRKTGKSFLIEHFIKWDRYFFIKRGGEIFDTTSKKGLTYESFIPLLDELMNSGKKIVIDEFHRLPDDFLDFLHINSNKGKLTLISSTIWLSRRILEKDSPILGLFCEVPIGIIDERDILIGLKKFGKPDDLILLSTYLREPLMLQYLEKNVKPIKILTRYFYGTKFLVPLLVSSVFQEEDRFFTQIYEGVVRAIANGKINSKEITDFLFSRRLIPKAEHGYTQQYLHNLIKVGIVKKLKLFNSRRAIYRNASPMIDCYFYMDEKYNFSEQEIKKRQIEAVISEISPRYVEEFVGSFLAKVYGLTRSKILSPKLEIDIALHKFKKLNMVGEVKWKNYVSKSEMRMIEEKLSKYKCKKILIVPKKSNLEKEPDKIEILTSKDIIDLAVNTTITG